MLRMMMRSGRKVTYEDGEPGVEPRVEWVQRVTHKAERCMENVGMRGWVDAHWHLKQKWYNELLSNDRHTWAHWSFNWCPPGQRAQGKAPEAAGQTTSRTTEAPRRRRAACMQVGLWLGTRAICIGICILCYILRGSITPAVHSVTVAYGKCSKLSHSHAHFRARAHVRVRVHVQALMTTTFDVSTIPLSVNGAASAYKVCTVWEQTQSCRAQLCLRTILLGLSFGCAQLLRNHEMTNA